MAAVIGEIQCDAVRDVAGGWKMRAGQKRIVARVHDQRRHRNAAKICLAACALPIVVGVAVSMQGCRYDVVKLAQCSRLAHDLAIVQARKAFELREAFRFQRLQKMQAIEPVQAGAQPVSGGHQVEWRGHRCGGIGYLARRGLFASKPFQQRVAAKRDAGRE